MPVILLSAPMARIANGGEVSCGKSDERTVPMLASCGCLTPMAKLDRTSVMRSAVMRQKEKTTNCLMLREALMEFDMFLPATFGECVREEHEQWTWASSVGTIHQLDYVALSDSLRSNGVRALVDDSVDLATMRPDHRLVALRVHLGSGRRWRMARSTKSVGTIGMQSNLSKLARGFGRARNFCVHALQLNYAAGKS